MRGNGVVVIYSAFLISLCVQIGLTFGENTKLTVFYSVGVLIMLACIVSELKWNKGNRN
ncbi:MAG: hypothetical protein ACI33M_01205 [Lysinibacillus sp.]